MVSFFGFNKASRRIYAFTPCHERQLENGTSVPQYREIGPLSDRSVPIRDIADGKNWDRIDDFQRARIMWEQAVEDAPTEHRQIIWLITGTVLPVWDRLPGDHPRVYRMQTTDDKPERILGRVVGADQIHDTLKRLGLSETDAWQFCMSTSAAVPNRRRSSPERASCSPN